MWCSPTKEKTMPVEGGNTQYTSITTNDRQSRVQVQSRSAMCTTLIDFGKNGQNVQSIVEMLQDHYTVQPERDS